MEYSDIISPNVGHPVHDILRYDLSACQKGGGGSVISMFKDLAVPAGLLYLQQAESNNYVEDKLDEPISQNLYDKLFYLAEAKPNPTPKSKSKLHKNKITRRKKIRQSNKTRRK